MKRIVISTDEQEEKIRWNRSENPNRDHEIADAIIMANYL
jgi:hypothetical protein